MVLVQDNVHLALERIGVRSGVLLCPCGLSSRWIAGIHRHPRSGFQVHPNLSNRFFVFSSAVPQLMSVCWLDDLSVESECVPSGARRLGRRGGTAGMSHS